jgi:hypothetical protein
MSTNLMVQMVGKGHFVVIGSLNEAWMSNFQHQ